MKNIKLTLVMLFMMMSLWIAQSANALVINFDDIGSTGGAISNGYKGLNWDQFNYIDGATEHPGSGYDNGTVSGSYTAFNRFANTAYITGNLFDFNSVYLTAAWRDGLNIEVEGFLAGTLLYSTTVVVNTTGPSLFNLNYMGIDELVFDTDLGVDAGLGDDGYHFTMDNLDITVPEPGVFALMSIGLLSIVVLRRKKSV